MPATRPGDWLDPDSGLGSGLEDIQPGTFNMTIPTDRYTSREYAQREREAIWLRVWQIVGRADDLPRPGDWKKYNIQDQSFIVVRGKDEKLRGFVNACRHRGNALCITETGNAKRGFLCQYHLCPTTWKASCAACCGKTSSARWTRRRTPSMRCPSTPSPDSSSSTPDPQAAPLREYLGDEVYHLLEPYNIDQFTTVMDVKEPIDCNWKVVMDAFEEGYHINGIHPQLLAVLNINPETARYQFFDKHSVAVAPPFEVQGGRGAETGRRDHGAARDVPRHAAVIPRFQELVAPYQAGTAKWSSPDGVTARGLLQEATRDVLTGMGLDVSGLTNNQMSDNQGWVLFPNYFMTVRAGECHVIMSPRTPIGIPTVASGTWPATCTCRPNTETPSAPSRSWWTSREATSTSRRFTRIMCRCRASNSACVTTGSTTCRW